MTTEREDAGLQDARVSARYRDLAREEPSAQLDAAILGAARARAARPRVRRWAVPVSLAAVLVLSVIVTTRIHEEAPELESGAQAPSEPAAKPTTPPTAQIAKEAPRPPQRRVAKPEPAAPRADATPPSAEKREALPIAAAPAASPAPVAEREAARPAERSASGTAPSPAAVGAAFEQSPQEWLEHIARLRAEGRGAEADESLARFRRRYPDYRIPEAMRAKVLPR